MNQTLFNLCVSEHRLNIYIKIARKHLTIFHNNYEIKRHKFSFILSKNIYLYKYQLLLT